MWLQKATCVVCGKTERKHNKTETCSYKCRDALRTQKRLQKAKQGMCPICENRALLSFKANDVFVCSKQCTYRMYRRGLRKQAQHLSKPIPKVLLCDWCGQSFAPDRHNARFCTKGCRDRFFGRAHAARRQERVRKKKEKFNRAVGQCALCGVIHDSIKLSTELGSRSNNGKFHKDHIIPQSQDGKSVPANERYLCWFCNLARRDIANRWDAAIAAAGQAFWRTVNDNG